MTKSCTKCVCLPVCELRPATDKKITDERLAAMCGCFADAGCIPGPLKKREIIAAMTPDPFGPYCVCRPYDPDAPLDLNEAHGPAHKCVPYSEEVLA